MIPSIAPTLPLLLACFAAGVMDSVAGGGGLITVPALLNAGVPLVFLLGTNKSISSLGSSVAVWRYARAGIMPQWPRGTWVALVALAVGAGVLGAAISQIPSVVSHLRAIVPALLLGVMAFLARRWFFPKTLGETAATVDRAETAGDIRGFKDGAPGVGPIALYDGLLGPGTGTFLLMFLEKKRLPTLRANAATKTFNLSSNVGALFFFATRGRVIWTLGLTCAGAIMLGNLIGSTLVLKRGQGLIRVAVLVVTTALIIKYLLT